MGIIGGGTFQKDLEKFSSNAFLCGMPPSDIETKHNMVQTVV